MDNLPHIKQLQYLVTLYDYQHFGKAAEACHISQSTLSASVTALEEKLGAQLLERDHKTFIFTPLGRDIVKRSRDILESCQNISDLAADYQQPMTGEIHIGCIPTIAPFLISDLMREIKQNYKKLHVKLREETTDEGLKSLEKGDLDILVLALPFNTSQFHTRTLAVDPFLLTLHEDLLNHQFHKDISTWPDGSLFLLEQEHCLTGHTLQACKIKDKRKINPFHATSLYTIKEMINDKQGVSFMPKLAISSGILNGSDLVTIPQQTKDAFRELGMAWRKTTTRNQTFRAIGDLIAKILERKLSTKNQY